MVLHVLLYVCRPLTQCRLRKTTALAAVCQWAAEQDRPVSCCMAVVTMRLGGRRRSMPDGFSRYLIIVLEISGPWLSGI
jgi:hypothetical protein